MKYDSEKIHLVRIYREECKNLVRKFPLPSYGWVACMRSTPFPWQEWWKNIVKCIKKKNKSAFGGIKEQLGLFGLMR